MSQRDDKRVEDDKLIGRVLASWEETLARRSPGLSLGLVDNRGAIESRLRTSAFLILATLLFASLWPTVLGVARRTASGLISILLKCLLFSIWFLNPLATVVAVGYAFRVRVLVESGPPGVISESGFAIVWICFMAFVRICFCWALIGSGLLCMSAREQRSAGVNTETCTEMDRLERGTGKRRWRRSSKCPGQRLHRITRTAAYSIKSRNILEGWHISKRPKGYRGGGMCWCAGPASRKGVDTQPQQVKLTVGYWTTL